MTTCTCDAYKYPHRPGGGACIECGCAISNVAVISPLAAARIVRAIERGEIPALRINYGGEHGN